MVFLTPKIPSLDQVIFGGAPIGNLYQNVDETVAKETIEQAVKSGIKVFDTAPHYGMGLSEIRLGKYLDLQKYPDLKISSKCGRYIVSKDILKQSESQLIQISDNFQQTKDYIQSHQDPGMYVFDVSDYPQGNCLTIWDYSEKGILESVNQSLKRLQINKIDIMRLHDAENEERFQQAIKYESSQFQNFVELLQNMKQKGVISQISLGMNKAEYHLKFIERFCKNEVPFDSLMVAGCWNLLDQDGYELFQKCSLLGIKVHNVGIFAAGALWGMKKYKYEDMNQEIFERIQQWEKLIQKWDTIQDLTLPELALHFALLPDIVEYIGIGLCSPQQVEQNVSLFTKQRKIPIQLWIEAQQLGLLRKEIIFQ